MNNFLWNLVTAIYRCLGPQACHRLSISTVGKAMRAVFMGDAKRVRTISTKYGFLMRLDGAKLFGYGYFYLGEANPFETRVMRHLLQPGDDFVDVGANMGWFALNAAQIVGEQGKVYAFEPNPDCAKEIERSCSLNGFGTVSVIRDAVSDIDGTATFWIGADDVVSSLDQHRAESTRAAIRSITVPTVTLDSFFDTRGGADSLRIVKIDAEGGEMRVLRGAIGTLKRHRPHLIVEYPEIGYAETCAGNVDSIVRYLQPLGYAPYEFMATGVRRITDDNYRPKLINVLMSANESELLSLGLLT